VTSIPPTTGLKDRRTAIARVIDHVAKHIGRAEFSDDFVDVRMSSVAQGELDEGPWALFVDRSSQTILDKLAAAGTPLRQLWSVEQGVVPSPLRLTPGKLKELPAQAIEKYGLKVGDGIFVLSEEEVRSLALTDAEKDIIKPYYKNSDIQKYFASSEPTDYLVYTTSKTKIDDYPTIKRHLEKFRAILEARLSSYDEDYNWFELHRARDQRIFENGKVVCGYRTEGAAFAYHEGDFYGSTDMYFIKPRVAEERHSLKYLTAVLNSSVVDFWQSLKGKPKGEATEQFSTPLESVPIRRISFDDKQDVKLHDKVVGLVDEMVEAKRELARLNGFFAERLTRLAGPGRLPEVSVEAVTRSLAGSDLRRVHNHPKVTVEQRQAGDFVLARIGAVESATDLFTKDANEKLFVLKLSGKGRKTILLIAPKEILTYLQRALKDSIGKPWEEIKDLETYKAKEKEILSSARALLHKVESLQARIDAIVHELYGLSAKEIKAIEGQRMKGQG
jgi:hypothetical protein